MQIIILISNVKHELVMISFEIFTVHWSPHLAFNKHLITFIYILKLLKFCYLLNLYFNPYSSISSCISNKGI